MTRCVTCSKSSSTSRQCLACRRFSLPALVAPMLLLFMSTLPQSLADEDQFESHVRPLLIQHCLKCHGSEKQEAGLRLDSRNAALRGGDSGPAISIDQPESSLLIRAVRQQDGLEMPPDGKLTITQIEHLLGWIRGGAVWPGTVPSPPTPNAAEQSAITAIAPDAAPLADSLQLWLRADALQLNDGEPVYVWPDESGHGRDLTATRGIRSGGVGEPGQYIRQSTLVGRSAVRFTSSTGMATSPDHRPDITGDAALTITLVLNLRQFSEHPSHSSVFGVGNPAGSGDPGRPLAALIEIDQTQDYSLDFAGGWGHDAILAPGSFRPHFNKPLILTFVKQPGPIRETTRFYLNGQLAGPLDDQPVTGRDTVPDIQYRDDIGIFLGRALTWCGAFEGDIAEVLLYNSALNDADRFAMELGLGEKYGLWIDQESTVAAAATYSDQEQSHWAWQPLQQSTPPAVSDETWIRTPIDRFTLSALQEHFRQPASPLDRRQLLRRVTFDLIGLPPTPAETDAFLADRSPDALAIVVDRLLASPHYGERWARHWLDVVRYAETTANDANAVMRYAWRYRNYVIDAFNSDLPYDQFLTEQLAGDLLPPADDIAVNTRRSIATGFLMIGPKALAETDKEQSRLDIIDDQIDVTGRAMLGMTLACARCHDHKFDPIRATDYYALAGIFRSTEPFQNENRNATMWWEYSVPQANGAAPLTIMAPRETQPRNLRVHIRGNRFTLGKIVPRGMPGIINAVRSTNAADASPPPLPTVDPHQLSSGRLELAHWITSPDNPLTARVIVNRIWQLHFGQGIVATSDNFGTRGASPSHPQLLDWLAAELIRNNWSLKQLQRQIVLSNTYQQSSAGSSEAAENSALAALSVQRRRLSAEELRDALLAVSGQLDATAGTSESGEFLYAAAEDINALIRPNRVAADDEFYTSFRKRSVYLPIVRNMLPDVLSLFDAADPNGVTTTRNQTTVASQSLFLMNHPFVRDQAAALAARLHQETPQSPEQRIDRAHQLAFGRRATAVEQTETAAFLMQIAESPAVADDAPEEREKLAWQAFCQALLCSNEFLYVE